MATVADIKTRSAQPLLLRYTGKRAGCIQRKQIHEEALSITERALASACNPFPLRYPVRTGPGAQPDNKGATRTVRMGWRRFWRRRESNPRPTVRPEGPYMLSRCWLRSGQAQRRPTTIVPGGLYKSYSRPGPQPSPSLRWRSVPAREGKPGRASCYLLSSESKLFVCT